MEIYITAIVKAKSEHREEVVYELKNVVGQSRKETANKQYNLHQCIEDKNTLTLYEAWIDETGLDAHNEQPYFKALAPLFGKNSQEPPIILLHNMI